MKRIMILALAILFVLPVLPAFADSTDISIDNDAVIDVSAPLSFTLSAAADLTKAEIFVGNVNVYNIEGDGSDNYDVEVDLSTLYFLGKTKITVNAYYPEDTETIEKNVELIKYNPEELKFSEDFATVKEGTASSLTFNSNKKPVECGVIDRGDDNKAVSMTFGEKVVTSNPYILKDGLGLQPGSIITLKFDVMVEDGVRLALEMRDQNTDNTRYPTNNGTNMASFGFMVDGVFCSGSSAYDSDVWYNTKIVINTVTTGMDIYAKVDGSEEYALVKSYPGFKCIGFNQVRFTASCSNEAGGTIGIDNIELYDYRLNADWYAVEKFEEGKLKLTFSKAMPAENIGVKVTNAAEEELEFTGSYDAETNVYTCEFAKPLNYGAAYDVEVSYVNPENSAEVKALTAIDGSKAYYSGIISAVNEKYPTKITNIKDMGTKVEFNVEGFFSKGEMLMVCRYDGNKLIGANYVKAEVDMLEYSVDLAGDDGEIVVYILDSNLSVIDTYR